MEINNDTILEVLLGIVLLVILCYSWPLFLIAAIFVAVLELAHKK